MGHDACWSPLGTLDHPTRERAYGRMSSSENKAAKEGDPFGPMDMDLTMGNLVNAVEKRQASRRKVENGVRMGGPCSF